MPVVSALSYQLLDRAGNPRVETWFTLEVSGTVGSDGPFIDLSPYYRVIEHAQAFLMSGGLTRAPISNEVTNIPSGSIVQPVPFQGSLATPVSARFDLFSLAAQSGLGTALIASGLAAQTSGIRFGLRTIGY